MNSILNKVLSLIVITLLFQGCGLFQKSKKKNGGGGGAEIDTSALIPPDRRAVGSGMSAAELALAAFNPAMAHACEGQLANPGYQQLIDALGGIRFGEPLRFFRNENMPYLVVPYPVREESGNKSSAGYDDGAGDPAMESDNSAKDAETAEDTVDIKRADLIGSDGSKVIFLSKTHGLFFVETAGEKPRMTCTLMVPGEPKNFYVVNSHLILINNSSGGTSNASIVVYAISDAGLTYKSHHLMENQEIIDSRLFNDTLVTYANLRKPQQQTTHNDYGDYEESEVSDDRSWYGGDREFIVTSFSQITETPKVIFEDVLHNQTEEAVITNEFSTADVGRVISRHTQFKDFMSASDRYFVITREVAETYIERMEERTRNFRICVNYNPKYREVKHNYCQPNWQKIDNPGFDPNFSCHSSADFAQCVQANENKFVKSYWQYQGSTCQEHSYWVGRCEAYENKTVVTKTPVYRERVLSHLMIYKYENGSFIRFDDPTGLAPIVVSGRIKEHKSFQFRDGYLMIASSDVVAGSALRTFKLAEKALVFAGSVEKMGPGEDLKAVLFTEKDAYLVTFLRKDPLFRIDLSDPARPVMTGKLDVEGFSSQLIYHEGKLIGIGQTGENWNNHVKVSLFEVGEETFMSEIGFASLGADMDYSYNNSATDDQLHHFVPSAGRLYVPYTGWYERQASDTFSKVCRVGYRYPKHRLAIFDVGATLSEETALEFRGNIERVLEHKPGKALAFSSGSVNSLSEAGGKFSNETLKELYQTEGVYVDPSLPAGMAVAKQVVRSGGQLYKLRFVLGTREQIVLNQPTHVVEVSDDLVSCLGEPEIAFFNNELFVGHNLRHMREGYDSNKYDQVEIQISGALGWKISEAGFQAMNDAELAVLKSRLPTYCWIRPGVSAPASWEELLEHEARAQELYECKAGALERPGQVLNNWY